jgi:hypothetical protein
VTCRRRRQLRCCEMGAHETHLVEEEELPGSHQSRDDLNTTTLSVRDLVHVPREVDIPASAPSAMGLRCESLDVHDLEETVTPLLVSVSTNGVARGERD